MFIEIKKFFTKRSGKCAEGQAVKYTAGYPGQFENIEYARSWMAEFVNWYNTEHRHSAIGYVTPSTEKAVNTKKFLTEETIQWNVQG